MKTLIASALLLWKKGFFYKAFLSIAISFYGVPFVEAIAPAFKAHIYPDLTFAKYLIAFITVDTCTGVYKHYKNRTICFKSFFWKLAEKMLACLCGLILFNGLAKMLGADNFLDEYITIFGKLSIAIYITASAFENIFEITGGKFPPIGWMNKLKKFNEDGSVTEFKQ